MTQHSIAILIRKTLVGAGVYDVLYMLIMDVSPGITLLMMDQWAFTAAVRRSPIRPGSLWDGAPDRFAMNGTTEMRLANKNVIRTIATVTRSVIRLNVSSVRKRVADPAKNIQWFSVIFGEMSTFCHYVTIT